MDLKSVKKLFTNYFRFQLDIQGKLLVSLLQYNFRARYITTILKCTNRLWKCNSHTKSFYAQHNIKDDK